MQALRSRSVAVQQIGQIFFFLKKKKTRPPPTPVLYENRELGRFSLGKVRDRHKFDGA